MAMLLLVGRLLIALMFFWSGWTALSNIPGTAGYFADLGFPLPTLVTVGAGLFEIVVPLMLVVGWQARRAAAALAAFTLAATFIGHYGQGDSAGMAFMHTQMLLKDIAVAGGLIMLAVHGPGAIALDARRG